MRAKTILTGTLALLAACAAPKAETGVDLERALAGRPQVSGSALNRRIAAAAAHPLGSRHNPVRVEMPAGQHAYLRRLRCSDGRAPAFERLGNLGIGVYGNIIDGYRVSCGDAPPGRVEVHMDMYHRGHVEHRPVPGFTIVPS